jgi:hypothetical protein
MAEETKPAQRAKAPKAEPAPKVLLPASESSDPAVHQVLAQMQTAQANHNADEVERLTKALANLGFE